MSAEARMQFEVCKASGRLRVGQVVDCGAGASIDGATQLPGRLLTGVPGPLKYYARFLPVPRVHAENTVRALSVLGHPNVIAPIGVGGADGDVFVVQELPEGDLLDRMIQRGRATGDRLKLREVEQVFRQVATALRHAHQAQIRHGSLGSSQVRVSRQSSGDLNVQVVDFGMLPLLAAHAPSLSVHEWHQLSPEQSAQPSNASVASDLFALGVLLIELLTGYALVPPAAKMPWRELSLAKPGEVRATVARERPETPDPVLDLVASLLRARPEDRTPATAMDLARVLPRLSWEPRAEPSPADPPSRSAARAEPSLPSETPRAATMAPSRSFVVAGSSYSRVVAPSAPAAPPPPVAIAAPPVAMTAMTATPLQPVAQRESAPPSLVASSIVRFDDDATLSEVPGDAAFSGLEPEVAPAPSPRSWFVSEETVLTTQAPARDDASAERVAPLPDGTRIVAVPERTSAASAAARRFFQHEGTAVLAHPDQLAAPRGEVSTWDSGSVVEVAPAYEPPAQETTQPVPREELRAGGGVPAVAAQAPPVAAFTFATIESTMPDVAMPDPLRAALASQPLPPRRPDPHGLTMPPPRPVAPPDDADGVHPVLLVLVVVAGGLVLGLVLWGFLHS